MKRLEISDNEIIESWNAHDDNDVSTEKLLQMVADDCDCGVDYVVETLQRKIGGEK